MNTQTGFKNKYQITCLRDGQVVWEEIRNNLVMNEGLNQALQRYFKGVNYTAEHFVGLKEVGSIAATDTLALHPGWFEFSGYEGERKNLILSDAEFASLNNSANRAVFDILFTGDIEGVFVCDVVSGTLGVLFGAVNFAMTRSLIPGDQLVITCTFTQASI